MEKDKGTPISSGKPISQYYRDIGLPYEKIPQERPARTPIEAPKEDSPA